MKTYYKVTGLVFGNYWGGGKGAYKAESYEGEDLDIIREEIKTDLKSGALDRGMGYESLIGALMTIEIISTITVKDKEFSNSEWEDEFFGDLTEEQKDFLTECLY